MNAAPTYNETGNRSRRRLWQTAGLALGAIAMLLWVFAANGRILFYYDTVFYIDVGDRIINLILPASVPAGPENVGGTGGAAEPGSFNDATVNAARSLIFALIAGIIAQLSFIQGVAALQAGLTMGLAWIIARNLLRTSAGTASATTLTFLPLVVCGFSALPFYVAYFMPDLMASLGILAAALIIVFGRQMPWPEFLLTWCIAALAATVHLSHLAIIALLVPVAAIIAPIIAVRRWWLPALWLTLVVIIGLLPLVALKVIVAATPTKDDVQGNVIFTPFITARLVVDGPGLTFLENYCPNSSIATCKLLEALNWSDDPFRMTASHIIFETDPRLASYRLLPEPDQRAIAEEQSKFFAMVLRDQPLGVVSALLYNTLQQAGTFSIDMTLPSSDMAKAANALPPEMAEQLTHGRITRSRGWIDTVDLIHTGVYAVSIVTLLCLLLKPGPAPKSAARYFALIVILGLLANALICGGISQPASRYGARTAWLLPYLATLLAILARAGRSNPGDSTP